MRCLLMLLLPLASALSSDYFISSLPDVNVNDFPTMHSGLIDVGTPLNQTEHNLFFWHVQSETTTKSTVLWLNGGPGCSSLDGGLLEVGPFRFEGGKIHKSNGWTDFTNMLFLDQPFGTGFSSAESKDFVESLETAAEYVVQFLLEYAKIFPEIRNTKLYLSGESFAGQYIPHIWKHLQTRQDVIDKIDRDRIGVRGVMLIAPWIDPAHQYISQSQFAKENGLIDSKYFPQLDDLQTKCVESLQNSVNFENNECEVMNEFIMQFSRGGPQSKQCFNIYDVSKTSPLPSCGMEWPATLPFVTEYLNREDVQNSLHVEKGWHECSSEVHKAMKNGEISSKFINNMIEQVDTYIVAGDNDWICNHLGLEHFIRNLKWGNKVGFTTLPIETEYGSIQVDRKLTFARVQNGSHMIPLDHLEVSSLLARQMLNINTSSPVNTNNEINMAVYRAYKQAGVIALVVVLVLVFLLGVVYWRGGHHISGRGLLGALLHFGRGKSVYERVELREMGRRPSVIIEEEEE